jgi:transcriptional regulator with XRE-family HTH domain
MKTIDQRQLLGAFVRAHRERLRPEGDPGRRRTPGLRREELAARAGISPTWCTWIEQGREVKASSQALGRLARALELSRAERAYLFDLAEQHDPDALASELVKDAPAAIQAALSAIKYPAYGLDRLWNACCWNKAAERLFTGWLSGNCQRNLLRFMFLDPAAKILVPNWQDRARRLLAEFRADYSHTFTDPRVLGLVEGLRNASTLFAESWKAQVVLDREGGVRTFFHPKDGPLRFVQHSFSPAERPDYKLVILIPTEA